MRFIIATVLCLAAVSAVPKHHHNIHKRMTPVEVKQVFGTLHTNVPDYKVVNIDISRIQNRSESAPVLMLSIDGDHAIMATAPANGFLVSESTQVMLINGTAAGLEFRRYVDLMTEIGELVDNPETRSFFILSKSRAQRDLVNGYIGTKNLVIRSLPERLSDSLSTNSTNYHVSYNLEVPPTLDPRSRRSHRAYSGPYRVNPDYSTRTLFHTIGRDSPRLDFRANWEQGNNHFPAAIYPQIMVTVDSSYYDYFQGNVENIIINQLILWHGVKLRYESFGKPKVRINIACFIISVNVEGSPFIMDGDLGKGRINPAVVLLEASKFWHAIQFKVPLPRFDAIMMFTWKRLVVTDEDIELPYARVSHETNGASYFHTMCRISDYPDSFRALGIITDRGSFDALATSQVLASLFGIDSDSRDFYKRCSDRDNYVMSSLTPHNPSPGTRLNNWDFSACSKEKLQQNLQMYNLSCVYGRPRTVKMLLPEIILYNKLRPMDICSQMFGPGIYSCEHGTVHKQERCKAIHCRRIGKPCIKTDRIPPDGTRCGLVNEYCEKGTCIDP